MKHLVYIFMIVVLVCTVFTLTSVSVFAEGEAPAQGQSVDSLKQDLGELKDELVRAVKNLWDFIMDNETYKNVFKAIVAIIAFLLLPLIVAVLFVAYLAIAGMTIVAAALTSVIEMIIRIVAKFLPV